MFLTKMKFLAVALSLGGTLLASPPFGIAAEDCCGDEGQTTDTGSDLHVAQQKTDDCEDKLISFKVCVKLPPNREVYCRSESGVWDFTNAMGQCDLAPVYTPVEITDLATAKSAAKGLAERVASTTLCEAGCTTKPARHIGDSGEANCWTSVYRRPCHSVRPQPQPVPDRWVAESLPLN